jgi:FecR protein
MRRVLAAIAILGATAFAQPPQQPQGPWSEQPPNSQQAQYGQPPAGYPQPNYPQQGQPQGGPPPSDADPNAAQHAVARISFMNGNVSVRRGDSADLVAGVINAPLTVGDRVVTGDNSRAEVQLDYSNFVRLAPNSEIRLSDLERGKFQVQVAAGTISFRVLRDSNAQVEISTPSISVRPLHIGVYRVNVKPDGITEITLRNGADGEVFGPRGSEPVHNSSTMMVRGSSNDPEFQVVAPLAEDDFDRWNTSRDQTLERANAPTHVNHDIYGTEDMDQYGHWVNDGSYGQVWVPQVAPGWAPYGCGRWVWIDYYGWSWVGCEPWAWAPYHYGRWYQGLFGWAWWPGVAAGPVFWRPALVGFFGWGAPGVGVGIGFGFGFANVGWVPLAPFEAFRPWYGAYGYRAGFIGTANVAAMYRNARVANAVSGMRAGDFGRASLSSANMMRASAGDLAHAGAVNGRLPMSVSNESRQFTNRAANTQGAPRTAENARFFSSAGAGRSGSTVNASGARSAESGAARGNAGANSGGWQRISPNSPASRTAATSGTERTSSGGWSRVPAGGGAGSGGGARGGAQPQVRINPSIVQDPGSQNRGSSRPSGQQSAPRNGGGSRGGSSRSSGSRGGRQ